MVIVTPKPSNYGVTYAMVGTEAVTTTKTPGVAESQEVYTNEGDSDGAAVTLPTAVAGLTYTFYIQTNQTLTITAASGDTIRIASNATPAAGNISSSTVGSWVTLLAINATEWVAVSSGGTWAVSS